MFPMAGGGFAWDLANTIKEIDEKLGGGRGRRR